MAKERRPTTREGIAIMTRLGVKNIPTICLDGAVAFSSLIPDQNTLVATIMSNAGLDATIQAAGGRVVRTGVGDKQVIDEMLKGGYNCGGEQSGHLIYRDFSTTGDGLVAALQVLRIMKAKGMPLSRLAGCWTRFPQIVTNIRVREKRPFDELAEIGELVSQAETELKPQGGRVLLRYSGTEPKARLLLEGRDNLVLEKWSEKISHAVRKQVGAFHEPWG